ncbi:MAG TPA: FtsX-like permease family protein [Acidimicrobiia bacterium]|nr:FtsX-like permease family protein [Acidimicrobiia bacterium]
MSAVWMLAGSGLRRRLRSLIALTLLVGVVGAVVLSTAAGARRSSTALTRFIDSSHASDFEIDTGTTSQARIDDFLAKAEPEIAGVAELMARSITVDGYPNLLEASAVDTRIGTVVDRARVLRGREANPDASDEIAIGESLARQSHLKVGDRVGTSSFTPAQRNGMFKNHDPGPPAGPHVTLRIVGIVRRPLDLGDRSRQGGVMILTPAFEHTYGSQIGLWTPVLRVHARHGSADAHALRDLATRMFGTSDQFTFVDNTVENRGASSAINVLTITLWIFAGVAALAGGVALSIVLLRDGSHARSTQPTLRAVGLVRRERVLASAPRALIIALGGAGVAVMLAIVASQFFPVGLARRAESSPGIRFDPLVLGVGAAIILAFVAATSLTAALRTARVETAPRRNRRSSFRDALAQTNLPPAPLNGLRMAFDPGRDERAVPIRSAIIGTAIGLIGITAVAVYGQSLSHAAATPARYGWTFDFKVADPNPYDNKCGSYDDGLHGVSGIADIAAVCFGPVSVEQRQVTGFGFVAARGRIQPEILAGRAPKYGNEVALGTKTLAALHQHLGGTVHAGDGAARREYHIVGTAVLPLLTSNDIQPLADGAVFARQGLNLIVNSNNLSRYIVARYAPTADRRAIATRVPALPDFQVPSSESVFVTDRGVQGPQPPPEIDRLRTITWFPPALIALLAILSCIAVAHALVTSARRRGREIAVFKTLGFRRRDVGAMLAWQASALVAVGLVFGLALGVLVGRAAWAAVAHSIGISTDSWVPPLLPVATALGALVLVNLLAYLPGRAAARIRPAVALRTE